MTKMILNFHFHTCRCWHTHRQKVEYIHHHLSHVDIWWDGPKKLWFAHPSLWLWPNLSGQPRLYKKGCVQTIHRHVHRQWFRHCKYKHHREQQSLLHNDQKRNYLRLHLDHLHRTWKSVTHRLSVSTKVQSYVLLFDTHPIFFTTVDIGNGRLLFVTNQFRVPNPKG